MRSFRSSCKRRKLASVFLAVFIVEGVASAFTDCCEMRAVFASSRKLAVALVSCRDMVWATTTGLRSIFLRFLTEVGNFVGCISGTPISMLDASVDVDIHKAGAHPPCVRQQ